MARTRRGRRRQDRQYLHKARKADSQATRKAAAVSCVFSKPFSCHGLEIRRSVLLGPLPTLVWLIFTSVFYWERNYFEKHQNEVPNAVCDIFQALACQATAMLLRWRQRHKGYSRGFSSKCLPRPFRPPSSFPPCVAACQLARRGKTIIWQE